VTWLDWASYLAAWAWSTWIWGDFFCTIFSRWGGPKMQVVARAGHWFYMELRPFRWVLLAVAYLPEFWIRSDKFGWWNYLLVGFGILINHFNKHHDEDDRWKRRKKKAAEAIKRVGTRLVVVPTS
jgi:hypothetical protein